MKDESHHIRHVQRKVLKTIKHDKNAQEEKSYPTKDERSLDFKRPKTLQNKRKVA